MIEIKYLFDMENEEKAKDCINQSKDYYNKNSSENDVNKKK